MNKIVKEDLLSVINSPELNWDELKNSSILITGATGLIGSMMTKLLLLKNIEHQSNISIVLLVRSIERMKNLLSDFDNIDCIEFIESSIEDLDLDDLEVDFIIHTAAPTKSKFFVDNPVETMQAIIFGTEKILRYAYEKNVKKLVNVSSMEVYGTLTDVNVTEEKSGYIALDSVRSSYPESKRVSELLSYAYYKQYGLNVNSLRLGQTFGPGISKDENRLFKYLCDCILEEKDIVLKSTGETITNFCYLSDALKAILILLLKGDSGQTYNATGESYNMNINDIVTWLIKEFNVNIELHHEIDTDAMFAPVNQMILNSDKLKSIGWSPTTDVKKAYSRLIEYLKIEG